MKKNALICCLSLIGFIANVALGQDAVFSGTALVGDPPSDPIFFDSFGSHVAADKKWLMIGAPREDIDLHNDGLNGAHGDIEVGAVYIYRRTKDGLVRHQKIQGEGNNVVAGTSGDRFGAGIVLQEGVMFVGAANDDTFPGYVDPTPHPAQDFFFAGQVYVFKYDSRLDEWVLVQKLISDEPNSFGAFGARTDSSHMELFSFGKKQGEATIALIGEVENATGIPPKLHVFRRKKKSDQWDRIQTVGGPSGVANSSFADSVERIGKYALVTESFISDPVDPAAVHLYRVDSSGIVEVGGALMPVQTLHAPGGPNDRAVCGSYGFGKGMDAANDIVVIADPCNGTAGVAAGAVHVYSVDNVDDNNPLSLVDTLISPNAVTGGFFGSNFGNGKQTVTTDGNLIAVGTANISALFGWQDPNQDDVHLYARDPDLTTFTLVDSEPSPEPGIPGFTAYGQSVTLLGGNQLAVAQMVDGSEVTGDGRVFLFDIQ
jgi:hypothetical protein